MNVKRWIKRLGTVLLAIAALLALAVVFVPWKPWVEARLVSMLHAQGFEEVTLAVSHLGTRGIELKNITIGRETPFMLNHLTVGYSLGELRQRRVREVTISGVTLAAQHTGDGWRIAGLDALSRAEETPAEAFTLPVTRAELAILPVSIITVEDSTLTLLSDSLSGTVPLHLAWSTTDAPKLAYDAAHTEFKAGAMAITTGPLTLDATLNETDKTWRGNWKLSNLALAGLPLALPSFSGEGTLSATATDLALDGSVKNADASYQAAFKLRYALAKPETSTLTITRARLPWNGGVLSVKDARIPLSGKRDIRFTLTVDKVSIGLLMEAFTGDKAKGTGTVSGSIPVILAADGTLRFGNANLQADAPGTIALAPEVIPGDNPQVVLVRDILKNLHYSLLTMRVENGRDNKLSLFLSVEGKNPDVANARPVRLNVQLNGDLIQLVTQSIMPMADPKQLLQQESR